MFVAYFDAIVLLLLLLSAVGLVFALIFSKKPFVKKHKLIERLILLLVLCMLAHYMVQVFYPQVLPIPEKPNK